MRVIGATLLFVAGCAAGGTADPSPSDDEQDPDGGIQDDQDTGGPTSTDPQLTVTKMGSGIGTIASFPAGIDCGPTCTASFAPSTLVTLIATATPGTTFMGWTGGCSGTASCTTTLDQTQTVSATFACDSGSQTFDFNGAVQTLTLAECVSAITVDAYGAQGGFGSDPIPNVGGLGARIQGTVPVVSRTVNVLVGGMGANQLNGHGGGGGGSFVYADAADALPLIVAGGGGGASSNSGGGCVAGTGSSTDTPTTSTGGAGNATGGANGAGGTGGSIQMAMYGGGGGGSGWLANGLLGNGTVGGNPGAAPRNGGTGGASGGTTGAAGGFGGGGGGINISGSCGGGGGFNGGGGGNGWNGSAWGCGGGGGSYNAGTAQTNTAGVRSGNGQVIVSW